jgi:hypothetical protein
MHCLYCDRPLALLKRLTGDGEFCSKEHRKIYQQEHNHLALARLLDAQPKTKEKPRPDNTVKPEPEIVDCIKEPEATHRSLPDSCRELGCGACTSQDAFGSAPRFDRESDLERH